MKKQLILSAMTTVILASSVTIASAATTDEGYYGAARVTKAWQKADNMDTSSRPGIGSFVSGDEKDDYYSGSLAIGYQYGNGWRTEAEYTLPKKTEFTSGSTNWPTSWNHHKVETQRVMLNAYRDYDIANGFSVYGMAGLGVAKIKSSGWQSVAANTFGSNTDTNIIYSVGVGASYQPMDKLNIDLGYRYIDFGKTESGKNNFTNFRRIQDEQMKASLSSNEIYLGARYLF